MNKRDFLKGLEAELADLTSEERREAMEYYEEYFADAGEENEADVLISLGSPEQAAEQIKAGLHKAEEGMFTENGYREKAESDNPPEVYSYGNTGRRGEGSRQEDAGQNGDARGNGAQNRDGYTGRNGAQNRDRYTGRNGAQHQGRYGGFGGTRSRNAYGQNPYGYQGKKEKKSNLSAGMIVLLVVLGIFAAPLLLALGIGIFGVALGILGTVFGVIVTFLVVIAALLVVGITLFVAGFPMLIANPFGGMLCIAAGCILISLFLLCAVLLAAVCGKFFPWLIREVESLGKYLSRKWSERKRKGGETV